MEKFTGEVLSVGAILETVAEQKSMKDQFKASHDKVEQYALHKFDTMRDIIIIRDLKVPYANVDMDNPIKLSKEDKYYDIIVTQLQEEAKEYVKRILIQNNL